jgi:hypothetical protein
MAPNDTVYAWISLENGSNVNPNGGSLTKGQPFYWANKASVSVSLTGCDGFCTASSYDVPAPPSGQTYGLKEATLLSAPTNWNFSQNPNQWNVPGQPKIQNPPMPMPEVA